MSGRVGGFCRFEYEGCWGIYMRVNFKGDGIRRIKS